MGTAAADVAAVDFADRVIAPCSRCRLPVVRHADASFCPRCGLLITVSHPPPPDPMLVQTPTHAITVLEAIAEGDAARAYRCDVRARAGAGSATSAVFKIARRPVSNDVLKNEATTLRLLTFTDHAAPHLPFFPRVVESFAYMDETREMRRATVLAYDGSIRSPFELYSLAEVHAAYPGGLDARDAAWMLRRILSVLAFAHGAGVGHGAVTPAHVLIEPREHKLVLVGWGRAGGADAWVTPGSADRLSAAWLPTPSPRREADVVLAAKTIACLLGGDPLTMRLPDNVDAGIARFLERCALGRDISGSRQAGRLLADFDKLIEALWGRRAFHPFTMPRRS